MKTTAFLTTSEHRLNGHGKCPWIRVIWGSPDDHFLRLRWLFKCRQTGKQCSPATSVTTPQATLFKSPITLYRTTQKYSLMNSPEFFPHCRHESTVFTNSNYIHVWVLRCNSSCSHCVWSASIDQVCRTFFWHNNFILGTFNKLKTCSKLPILGPMFLPFQWLRSC